MKGALTVDEPRGERWGLALDPLSNGPDLVALGTGLLLNRDTSGPSSDGHIHIGIVASGPKEQAQSEVDGARQLVGSLAIEDERFGTLLRQSGVTWEYVGTAGAPLSLLPGWTKTEPWSGPNPKATSPRTPGGRHRALMG
jgi:hypothetical protein